MQNSVSVSALSIIEQTGQKLPTPATAPVYTCILKMNQKDPQECEKNCPKHTPLLHRVNFNPPQTTNLAVILILNLKKSTHLDSLSRCPDSNTNRSTKIRPQRQATPFQHRVSHTASLPPPKIDAQLHDTSIYFHSSFFKLGTNVFLGKHSHNSRFTCLSTG